MCKTPSDFMVFSSIPNLVGLNGIHGDLAGTAACSVGHLGIAQLVYLSDAGKGSRSGDVRRGILIRD